MSTEDEGDSHSSSLIAKQVAELDQLEELDQAKKMAKDTGPSVIEGQNPQSDYLHQTPALSQESKIQGSMLSSGMPQARPQVADTFTESTSPVVRDVADHTERQRVSDEPRGIGERATVPPKQSQSGLW